MKLPELDTAGPPRARRLYPRARPQVVARLGILVAREAAIALHEAKALELAHRERRRQDLVRVDQRPPDPLAVAGRNHEAIGVVHLGPEIGSMRLVLAELIHRRQRR